MKKIFTALTFLFIGAGLSLMPVAYAEENIAPDDEIQEAEVNEFLDELTMTLSQIFAWVGGMAGLGAVLAFVLRFIKDRAIMASIRAQIESLSNKGQAGADQIEKFSKLIESYDKREQALEKAIVSLITLSATDPEIKNEIIKIIQNDTQSIEKTVELGLEAVKKEKITKTQLKNNIEKETKSLLSKLSSK
jgi:hypothetical protein